MTTMVKNDRREMIVGLMSEEELPTALGHLQDFEVHGLLEKSWYLDRSPKSLDLEISLPGLR